MSGPSTIEWTDATWNPVTGCTKLSPGCDHCYAETMHERFNGKGSFANVKVRSERLHLPLKWRAPKRIFVNSMSDLFHKDVPTEFIAEVFAVMAFAERHTFQVLTKRHARMRSLLSDDGFREDVVARARQREQFMRTGSGAAVMAQLDSLRMWPLPNVWVGVSVENQHWADIRIPALLDTPAAVRWISAEPLLGPIDLRNVADDPQRPMPGWDALVSFPHLDWVVVGGESGPGARPMHPDWVRQLRDDCASTGVPFLFKQWGAWVPAPWSAHADPAIAGSGDRAAIHAAKRAAEAAGASHGMQLDGTLHEFSHRPWSAERSPAATPGWTGVRRSTKKAAGRELDGVAHDAYPEATS